MTETVEPGTRVQRVRAEAPDLLEALLTAAGDHVERVLDVGTTPGGDLLLVLPEPAARLTGLLSVPGWPSAGEAVTVLVPLAQALQRMHAAGVAHGAAGAGSVVLDAAGAPAWTFTTQPVLLRRAGPAAFSAAADDDRRRFAELADAVVARTGAVLRAAGMPVDRLLDALFDLAEPQPVRLAPEPPPLDAGPPARLLGPVTAPAAQEGRALRSPAVLRRVAAGLAAVRRRVWVAVGAVAAALLAALVLLPAGTTADAAGGPVLPAPGSGEPGSARPSPARSSSAAGAPSGAPVAPRALDAGVALPRLLAERARCLAAGDGACLDRVVAAGSPVRAADRTAITAGTDPVLTGDGRPKVLSDGGGTVVADVGGVVVVAIRQQDGWRLRDVVAEPPG